MSFLCTLKVLVNGVGLKQLSSCERHLSSPAWAIVSGNGEVRPGEEFCCVGEGLAEQSPVRSSSAYTLTWLLFVFFC